MHCRHRAGVAAGVVMLVALAGCGGGAKHPAAAPAPTTTAPPTTAAPTTAAPTTTAPAAPVWFSAVAKGKRLEIYTSAAQTEPARYLDNPQPSGAWPGETYPLRMLVTEDHGDWLKVLLPIRPNGSSGWIRRTDVDLQPSTYRALVELGEHRITVWNGNDIFLQEPVGVGVSGRTPTTQGLFYVIEGYHTVPADEPVYGPYALALSGYSDVLYSFGAGGTGVLGIHGTGDPSSIGKDVSNGCIRMNNSAITKLATTVPLGMPVEIKA